MADASNAPLTQSLANKADNVDFFRDLVLNDDLAENKWPKEIDQFKTAEKPSLMTQAMSKELFDKLKDQKSDSGWTIARAINTGVCYPSSFVGCHAGDLESYHLFKEFYYPVIEKYHVGYKLDGTMKHSTDMDPAKIEVALSEVAKKLIVSTRIRCARNLAMFPLNTAGTKETRMKIAELMENVFNEIARDESTKDLAGKFLRHSTMTAEEEEQLIQDHFLFKGKDKMQAASGYHRFWPHGRGIFVSHDKKFLVWVNEGDHLRIISMESGGDVKAVFERFNRAVTTIERLLKKLTNKDTVFMSDPMLGMITCCPSNLGTGLRASVHCLVPKLIKKIGFEKIDDIARSIQCQARGTSGEHSQVIDRVDVSNWRRLGFTEYELIQDMIRCINKLADMEGEVSE
ncbi:arginine kinase-like [Mya arenaria]|uniref:arginine kinase-like n=1 Tax=Mya arenaria TaxID=6604 RepID=UPI0022E805B3|nr:arginine kinase-like [Mya arenaria]